ncbi:MAG: aspartate aminotransferase family protein, partial [Phenylobacterium sp.]|nr:aspartate aminotransferase family protein [Phenylobacterium sp.]
MDPQSLLARRTQVFGAGAALFYETPLNIVRGEGVYLFDADGRRYVDLYNNVPCVGHGNARVADAMARQQATLNVHSRYLHDGVILFAERLVGLQEARLESVVFSCSGSEANEVALQIVRIATGKRGVVCTNAAYHGSTETLGAVSYLGRRKRPSDEVRTFPFPETFRPLAPAGGDPAEPYLERLRVAIDELEGTGAGFAGLILCPLFANEGLPDIPREFLRRASDMVHAAGGLVIADEVQAGYGRTGRWWGHDGTGLAPDVVVTGKPMGNGLPLAATFTSRDLIDKFRARTRYINTFASTPLQAAVGMAVLDVIEEDGLLDNAAKVGAALKQALEQRRNRWPRIGDVRGAGLFIGVEMVA